MSRWQIRFSDHLLIKYPQASEIARIEMMLADEENKRLENSLWALDFADWINPAKTLRLAHHQLISGLSGGLKTSEGDTITSLLSWSFSGCTSSIQFLELLSLNTWSGLWLQGGSWCLSTRKPKKRLLRLRRERRKRERLDSVLFYDNKWHEQIWTLYD